MLAVMKGIVRQHGMTGWRDQKSHLVQTHDIPGSLSPGGIEKGDSAAVLGDGIADQHGLRIVRHDNPFEEISCDDVPFHLNSRFPGHRHAMIVVMDEILDLDRL